MKNIMQELKLKDIDVTLTPVQDNIIKKTDKFNEILITAQNPIITDVKCVRCGESYLEDDIINKIYEMNKKSKSASVLQCGISLVKIKPKPGTGCTGFLKINLVNIEYH